MTPATPSPTKATLVAGGIVAAAEGGLVGLTIIAGFLVGVGAGVTAGWAAALSVGGGARVATGVGGNTADVGACVGAAVG